MGFCIFERSLHKLSENNKIVEIEYTEFKFHTGGVGWLQLNIFQEP